MKTSRKLPTIKHVLLETRHLAVRVFERVGRMDVPDWEELSVEEKSQALRKRWPEIVAIQINLVTLQDKMLGIGRRKGQYVKLRPEDVRRIKRNGRRNITSLAKELGVSRQTIHNVLGKKEQVVPKPKKRKVKTVRLEEYHSRDAED